MMASGALARPRRPGQRSGAYLLSWSRAAPLGKYVLCTFT